MNRLIPFKRGGDFAITLVYKEDGVPTSIDVFTDIAMSAKRMNGDLVCSFDLTRLTQSGDTLGMFTFTKARDLTALWPAEDIRFDVRLTGANRDYSRTGIIPVEENIT